MNTLIKTTLKLKTILIFALCFNVSAGYVDVTQKIEARFNADKFIISANSDRDLGLGFGVQHKATEFYIGGGYNYAFTELVYKNGRHSIYDVGIEYKDDAYQARASYTHLVSDTFGLIVKYNKHQNKFYVGVRKWVD